MLPAMSPLVAGVVLVVGLALLVVGADVVVARGSSLAARWGVPPFVVGVTVVSIGTSLPELAVGVNAALQDNAGLAVGNIVGTNLVNLLLVLGPTVILAPGRITVPGEILAVDLALLVAVTVLAVPAFVTGRRLSRAEGGVFVVTYLVYLGYLLREIV